MQFFYFATAKIQKTIILAHIYKDVFSIKEEEMWEKAYKIPQN